VATQIKLDVYGKAMLAEHGAGGWRVFELGADGKRREVRIAVPEFIEDNEIDQYLDDLYHENATPAHPCVRRIGD
jgi:hypothetical protein